MRGRNESASSLNDRRHNENNITGCRGFAIARGIAYLAVQRGLGLLPEWGIGFSVADSDHIGATGPAVTRPMCVTISSPGDTNEKE